MKAKLFAVLLSLFVISLPTHAQELAKKQLTDKATTVSRKIDLNKADANALTGSFKGIGKKRAEAIVAYRTEHNGFKSLEEFSQIKGFGQGFVNTNREKLKEVFEVN